MMGATHVLGLTCSIILEEGFSLDSLEGIPCPFCPEMEAFAPPALEVYGSSGEWLVRVLPNRYPAFEGDQPFVVTTLTPPIG